MTGVLYKNYSMDARLVKVIAEALEDGNYLEIYLRGGELVHAIIKGNWTSIFTFGVVGWGDPYLYVVGERSRANEALLQEMREMVNGNNLGCVVEDHMHGE